MVKPPIFFALFALTTSALATAPENSNDMSGIRTMSIEKNAEWTDRVSSDEPPESCADFVLKKKDVREFFRVARHASEREYGHDLLMSRCSVSGKVVFRNGDRGEWKIDRARRGLLVLSDGRVLYFYCGKCHSKVFMESCDIDCINQ